MPEKDTQFLLGEITQNLKSLHAKVDDLVHQHVNIDKRLRDNEVMGAALKTKIGILGIAAGGAGSLLMTFVLKYTH